MGRRSLTIAMLASACGGGVIEASSIGGLSSDANTGADDLPDVTTVDGTTSASGGTSAEDTLPPPTTDASAEDPSDDDPSAGESLGGASTTSTSDDATTSGGASTTDDCVPVDETCDTLDNDCDGVIDEGSPANGACGACAFVLAADGLSYFALCAGAVTWESARTACSAFGEGVDLAIIDNEIDQETLATFVLVDVWIGLSEVSEGDWDWIDGMDSIVDGQKVDYNGWANDQPQGGEMNCGEFDPDQDAWADAECDQLQAYMCQHPA